MREGYLSSSTGVSIPSTEMFCNQPLQSGPTDFLRRVQGAFGPHRSEDAGIEVIKFRVGRKMSFRPFGKHGQRKCQQKIFEYGDI
jgi:hypothetical protein